MNDEPSDELPEVPEDTGSLEEETAPSEAVDDVLQSGAVPIKRSLNDLSAAEEASQTSVQFNPASISGSFSAASNADASGSHDSMPGFQEGQVPPAADSGQFPRAGSGQFPQASGSGQFPQASGSGQFPQANASGSFDQLRTPSGSFDQMLAAGTPGAYGQAHPAAEPKVDNRPPMAFLKRTVITLLVAIVAFLIVSYLAVSQWVPNHIALILMAGGMVVPTLLAGFFTSQRSKRNVLLRVFPALLFGAAGMGGAYAWSLNHVRAMAVPYAPPQVKSMKMMLGDPSHEIALAACQRFTPKHTDAEFWPVMFDLLNERPKLALECIETMPNETKTKVGGSLADRWAGELVKGETKDPKRACSIANGVSTLPIPPQEAAARLLQCTVSSEVEEIQACCGTALSGMVEDEVDWASRLAAVVQTAKDDAMTSGVLAMSLHGQGLSEAQKKLADDIGFASTPVRHVTLLLACESVRDENSQTVQHLRATLDAHCDLEMDEMPKGSQWAKVCRSSLQKIKEDPAIDPTAVLCNLTTDKPLAEAIAAAQQKVLKAQPVIEK